MQTLVVPLIGDLPVLLDTSASNAAWVITATLLTAAVATPVSGRLGDMYGKRRMMLFCAGSLIICSLVCALAAGVVPMIVRRALPGVGMGMLHPGLSPHPHMLPAANTATP